MTRFYGIAVPHVVSRKADGCPNLTIKNGIKAVVSRCHWGVDDYRLQVENLPKAPPAKGQMELNSAETINHIERIELKV